MTSGLEGGTSPQLVCRAMLALQRRTAQRRKEKAHANQHHYKVYRRCSKVGKVLVQCARVDEDVVDVHIRETTAVSEKVVHCALKDTGGIAKSKRHYAELEAPKLGLKRGTRDMPRLYARALRKTSPFAGRS